MVFAPVGHLARQYWHAISDHAFNVELGAFQVMPNHIHGILVLGNPENGCESDSRAGLFADCRDKACLVSTTTATRKPIPDTHTTTIPTTKNNMNNNIPTNPQSQPRSRFRNQGKNTVSSMIGGYKSAVTRHAHQVGLMFAWQPRFHDRIIRNNDEYQRIKQYIETNPQQWDKDRFFSIPTNNT